MINKRIAFVNRRGEKAHGATPPSHLDNIQFDISLNMSFLLNRQRLFGTWGGPNVGYGYWSDVNLVVMRSGNVSLH